MSHSQFAIRNPQGCVGSRRLGLGQTVIEMVLALLMTMVFYIGTVKVFQWFVVATVGRQRNYDCTRVPAGRPMGWAQKEEVDDINYRPKRDFCGGNETGVLPPPPKALDVWGKSGSGL